MISGKTEAPATVRRIVLTGFMGAGKSTVGTLLAARLGWRFVDSDILIERRAGMAVASIFSSQGEAAFRQIEAEAIRASAEDDAIVLALGGGAMENETTRHILQAMPDTCIVFLDAPLEVMVSRCLAQPGAADRPVLADREHLARRFANRLPHYQRAHLTISTVDREPDAVAQAIADNLRQFAASSAPA